DERHCIRRRIGGEREQASGAEEDAAERTACELRACTRAWFCAMAGGSCSFGTMWGRAADSASWKKTKSAPSTNEATASQATGGSPTASHIATLPIASAPP